MKAKITINEAKEAKQDDIFTAGNLVIAEDGDIVLVTSEYEDSFCFEGFCLNNKIYSDSWSKDYFKQFHGNIVISTEE